jgi:hypothetical protein
VLVVEGAVASEDDIVLAESHIPHQNLGMAVDTLVEVEFVGVEQMNHRALLATRRTPVSGRCCKDADCQQRDDE